VTSISRREWLKLAASAAMMPLASSVEALTGPNDKFDLLIRGGEVIDPSQSLRGKRDIAMRWGKIEAVEADIPVAQAVRVIDAAGHLVTPGLVDLHAHVYPYGSAIGLPADETAPYDCVTTAVSAGDAGANTFAALRRHIAAQTRTRLYAFVHIANNGLSAFPVAELYNIDNAQVEACAMTLAENSSFALGVKVRMSENVIYRHGIEPLKRAIQACERSGVKDAKVMVHIGGVASSQLMTDILNLLRPSDILTHAYSGFPNVAGQQTNILQDGKIIPAAIEAKKRGVVFDVGHGGGSFDFTVAEAAIPAGCGPDTISSDLHAVSGNTPGMPFLPWVMSKFMFLGYSLEEVIAKATIEPARVIDREPKLGTLQAGAPADVAIMELVDGPVSFVDTRGNKREGKAYLKPIQTVTGGIPFGKPYQQPFSLN
jgi:dihydroorotase